MYFIIKTVMNRLISKSFVNINKSLKTLDYHPFSVNLLSTSIIHFTYYSILS